MTRVNAPPQVVFAVEKDLVEVHTHAFHFDAQTVVLEVSGEFVFNLGFIR